MNCGYKELFISNHPNSSENGHIYEHRYIASLMLGRPLKKGEVVHHIDGDRTNNDFSNLMIFKTTSEHTAFHKGNNAYKEGDVWICDRKYHNYKNQNKNINKNICPICNKNYKSINAKKCFECNNKIIKSKVMPEKEILIKDLLSLPMVKIGSKYGVSDQAVRKWCIRYGLPYKLKDIKKMRNDYGAMNY